MSRKIQHRVPAPGKGSKSSRGNTRSKKSKRSTQIDWRRRLRWTGVIVLVVSVAVGAWLFRPFWQLSGQFKTHPVQQPSRLYGAPPVLEPGADFPADDVARHLLEQGYVELTTQPTVPGFFHRDGATINIYRRVFPSPRGRVGGDRIQVRFAGRRIDEVLRDGRELAGVWLDPPLVASYYSDALADRRPVTLEDLPEDLILSVLAAEDARFLKHKGLSIGGILRAAWVNLRAGGVVQGGSTLTQQLVKNLYLTHERRFERKVREALLSILLEMRYSKSEILQAYLNEIYWGRSGSVDVMGVGAASWAYFGKQPKQLTLAECATLAGMIQSPANRDPRSRPEAAKERRDEVLQRLAQLNWLPKERLEHAVAQPVAARAEALVAKGAPYFADAMAEEARRRFGLTNLDDAGFVLHTTLDSQDQKAAEDAVAWGLQALEDGWEKGRTTTTPLQSALVSLDPADGSVRAWVGGRDYGKSQFDRVRDASRQAGSSFKPIVYAAAFERRVAHPASFLEGSPYTVELASGPWTPQNSNGEYEEWVSVRSALERSLNVPTARLAEQVGLDKIIEMSRRLGVQSPLKSYPALALGAMEVTPLELATVYATLASGGVRHEPHGLVAVYDRQGQEVPGQEVQAPRRVLGEDVAFVVTQMLQGVLDHGTGSGARRDGLTDPLAGKTGTTNDRRDSWFAGYSPERVSLVWVGYDDNSTTRLSGSRAALPIWTRFTAAVRPASGYSDFRVPEGVTLGHIDPRTGGLAHYACSQRRAEYFLSDYLPGALCADDDPRWRRRVFRDEEPRERPKWQRRILDILRGGDAD